MNNLIKNLTSNVDTEKVSAVVGEKAQELATGIIDKLKGPDGEASAGAEEKPTEGAKSAEEQKGGAEEEAKGAAEETPAAAKEQS